MQHMVSHLHMELGMMELQVLKYTCVVYIHIHPFISSSHFAGESH